MKTFLKFGSIPVILFTVFFGLPKLFATLFNAHSDVGILAILVILCGICGFVSTKLYNVMKKEINNDEA